ncbi:MAG: GNAT family N-acetyltransferase [Sphaerochaeta sp.]
MPNNIRAIKAQDIPYLYNISTKTADGGNDATNLFNTPLLLGQYFSAPYFQYEPQLCSIALDHNNMPSGYAVGTSNTVLYNSWLNTVWLPPLQEYVKALEAKSDAEQRVFDHILKGHGQGLWEHSGYPAKLRIDLLPSIRGQGIGRSLVEEFITKLYEMKIPGVHLRISGHNNNVIKFYEKMGFYLLENTDTSYIMGKKIYE